MKRWKHDQAARQRRRLAREIVAREFSIRLNEQSDQLAEMVRASIFAKDGEFYTGPLLHFRAPYDPAEWKGVYGTMGL